MKLRHILTIAFLLIFSSSVSAVPPSPTAAKQSKTDTTNFGTNLSTADDTVQKALDTLDEVTGVGDSVEKNQDDAWNVVPPNTTTGTQSGIDVTYQDATNDVDFIIDVTPSSGNATLEVSEDAIQVKYDSTDFTEGANGLYLGASPTMTGSPVIGVALLPDAADGAILGSATAEWSDLYLADGAVIYGQADQTNSLTSSATGWTASLNLTADAFVPTTAANASGEIGYTGGAFTFFMTDDALSFTNAANVWTVGSTGDTIAITPATTISGAVIASTSVDITGAAGLILQNDETITNAVDGTIQLDGILDLASLGITNVGAIADDASFTITGTDAATVTVDSVLFDAGAVSGVSTLGMTGALTGATAITTGSATVDTGVITMIKGAQTSDPQTTFTMSADGVGALTIATANGSNGDITLTPSGGDTIFTTDITVSGGDIKTGAIALVVGDGTTTSITLNTDGTGDDEIVLEDDSIGDDEIDWEGLTASHIFTSPGITLTADSTLTGASPLFTLQDSDNAAGEGRIAAISSGGDNDVIFYLATEISAVTTDFIELDGVSETIDLLKPVVTSSTSDLSAGNVTLGVVVGTIDAGGATALEIPNGTANPASITGSIALDTDGTNADYTGPVLAVSTNGATMGYIVTMTDMPEAAEDNYIMKYNADTNLMVWEADVAGDAPVLNAVLGPTAAWGIAFDDEEKITWTTSQNTAGSFFTINNSVADVTNQVYLLDLDYSVDDNQANADYIIAQDAGGTVFTLSQDGDISTTGTIATSDTTEASAITTAAVTVAGGLGVSLDVWIGDDLTLDSDGALINLGADQDVVITHVADVGLNITTTGVTSGTINIGNDDDVNDDSIDVILHDGGIITLYDEDDDSSASLSVADGSSNFTMSGGLVVGAAGITLTGADADPGATAGLIVYDTTITGILDGGALRWNDGGGGGLGVRLIVDLDTDPSDDGYVVSYDATADKFVMSAAGAGDVLADASVPFTGNVAINSATPTLTLTDTDAADGTATLSFQATGANEVVASLQTDVAGTPTTYIELDGVSATIDLLQNTVLTGTFTDGTATLSSGAWSGISTLAMTGALSGFTTAVAGTSIEAPFIILGSAATAADTGAIRMPNASAIMFEADVAGTDINALTVTSAEVVQIGASGSSGVTITPALTISSTLTDGTATLTSGAWTGVTDITAGSATTDSGPLTMIQGNQTGDPQVVLDLTADANGDFSITTDTGDLLLVSAATASISAAGENIIITGTANTLTVTTSTDTATFDFGTIDLATDALDISDGNITNVGQIDVDTIIADGAALAIGDNSETIAIDSSDWNIDATGAMTGFSFDNDGEGNAITNLANAAIKAGASIDATKIADGSISNAEFQYLNGLTADLTTSLATGTVTISTLLDVNEEVDIDFDNADEEMTITNSAEYGAGNSQVNIVNTDADVGAQMYLLNLDYSADDGQANADFILAQDSGGTVWILGQNGDQTSAAGTLNYYTITDGAFTTTAGAVSGIATLATGPITATGTSTFATAVSPDAVDGATLGSATAEWSDLYLADSAVIYGEADSSNTITSSATGWTFAKNVTAVDATFTGTTTVSTLTQAATATPTWTASDSSTSADGTFDIKVDAATAKYAGVLNFYVDEGDGAGADGAEDVLFMKINGSGTNSTASGTIEFERIGNFEMGLSTSAGTATGGFVDFYENETSGTDKVRIIAPALAADVTLTLPNALGDDTNILATNGSGVLYWTSAGAATAWHNLVIPSDDETLNMAGYTTQWTWTETAADMFTIFATGAFGDVSVVVIDQNTGNPTNGTMLEITTEDADVDHLMLALDATPGGAPEDYVTHKITNDGTYIIDVTSDGTAAVDIVDGLTVGSLTSDSTIGGTTITASTGFALGDGDYVGITSNERFTFETAGTITVNGATLALGSNDITITGSIGATGARSTKVWATDIESTNLPTVGGATISPTNITPVDTADENATFYPILVDGATGTQASETDGEFTFNPSTGVLTATEFSGGGGSLTAVDAATGDSATDFFDAGEIVDARIADDITVTSTKKISSLLTTEQLRLSYDATNYATWTVTDDGGLTLVTVDADAASADITFSPDGIITLTPATTITGVLTTGSDIELGNVSDTTIARSGAGEVTIEGNAIIHAASAAGSLADDSIIDADIDQDGTFSLTGAWTMGTVDATTDFTVDGLVLTADTITNDVTLAITSTAGGIGLNAAANDQDITFTVDDGGINKTVTIDGSESTVDFGADDLIMHVKIHDAGTLIFYDDSDDTSVTVGPVANGTTVLGVTGSITASGNLAGATYGSDSSISDAELLTLDDGATTEILVGGGAGSAPVWTTATGTGAPVRATSANLTTPIIVDGSTLTFDESAADPNDADVALSAADGVLTIASVNGANNESITIDLDQTADTIIIGTGSSATSINTGSLNMVTTGYILGAINVVTTTDGSESPTAAQMYGTMFIADHATATSDTDYTLPTAAAGMAACFYDNGDGTGGIIVDAAADDIIHLNGTAIAAANAIDSPGVAGDGANGDFICLMAIDNTSWITLGSSGTWVDGGAD